MKRRDKVVVYRDKREEWRWAFIRSNGKTLADGSEGYKRKADCIKGARRVVKPIVQIEVCAV